MEYSRVEKVLVISRDPAVSHAVCTFLSQQYDAMSCVPSPQAELIAAEQEVAVIIADVKTPEAEELQLLCDMKERYPDLPVIFLSLYASQLSRRHQLFQNALFFPKPFDNEAVAAGVALLSAARRSTTKTDSAGSAEG